MYFITIPYGQKLGVAVKTVSIAAPVIAEKTMKKGGQRAFAFEGVEDPAGYERLGGNV